MPTQSLSLLDDLERIRSLDPAKVFQLTLDFPAQCKRAIELGEAADLGPIRGETRNVVLAGMGGSAAAGDYIQALMDSLGCCPFVISRDYSIPNWVDRFSLVICSSYSGNTEETLASYQMAKEAGAKVLCVTSGGRLAALADEHGDALIVIPGGQPPRTAIGYMLFGPVVSLSKLELLNVQVAEILPGLLEDMARAWGPETRAASNTAKLLAANLNGTTPVIYGLGSWQGAVAKRWKAQINENAKAPAFANVFPELNHNEILGWKGVDKCDEWTIISLEDGKESAKMQARRRFTFDSFPGVPSYRAIARGETLLQKIVSLSYLGDFVSLYMSVLLGVDPGDIEMLERLKAELARIA